METVRRLCLLGTFVAALVAVACSSDDTDKGAGPDGPPGADGGGDPDGGGPPVPDGFELVGDLNTRRAAGLTPYVARFVEAGGKAFFLGEDGAHGVELMATDGTPAGTKLVKDLTPGYQGGGIGALIAKDNQLYFVGPSGPQTALYRTDGTPEGTVVVAERQGGESTRAFRVGNKLCFLDTRMHCSDDAVTSLTTILESTFDAGEAITLGAKAIFENDRKLWATDGTTASPIADVEIVSGRQVVIGDKAVFWGKAAATVQPWVSDGTPGGTKRLADVATSESDLTMLALGSKVLVFAAGEGIVMDPGTATFTKLANLSIYGGIALGSGKALLRAVRRTGDPKGIELWVTDGTDAGTTLLQELTPGSDGTSIEFLGSIGGSAFFTAGVPGAISLFKSDGTAAGTNKIGAWTVDAFTDYPGWTNTLGRLLFRCADATSWRTLCTLDASGAVAVIPVNGATAPSSPTAFATLGDRFLFVANPGQEPGSDPVGSTYVSSGTVATTTQVGPRFGGNVATVGNKTFFTRIAPGGEDKWELAAFEAEPQSATRVAAFDFVDNLEYVTPYGIVSFGGKVWFAANSGTGSVIHMSDGTAGGTKSLGLTPTAAYAQFGGSTWPVVDDRLYLPTDSGVQKVDAAGNVTPLGAAPGSISAIDAVDGRVWFSVGGTLWFTDGTAQGTTKVKEVSTSSSGEIWRIVAVKKDLVYFFNGGGNEPSLHTSDGTEAGTKFLQSVEGWTRFRDGVAFSTDSGVSIVGASNPSPVVVGPSGTRLRGAGDRLFFASTDEAHGEELWISDGTKAGTKLTGDLRAGPGGSSPRPLAVIGRHVYLTADDGVHGDELWRYELP